MLSLPGFARQSKPDYQGGYFFQIGWRLAPAAERVLDCLVCQTKRIARRTGTELGYSAWKISYAINVFNRPLHKSHNLLQSGPFEQAYVPALLMRVALTCRAMPHLRLRANGQPQLRTSRWGSDRQTSSAQCPATRVPLSAPDRAAGSDRCRRRGYSCCGSVPLDL